MKQEGVQYDVQGHKNASEESVEWGYAQPEPFVKSLRGLVSRPTRPTTSVNSYLTIGADGSQKGLNTMETGLPAFL